MREGESELLSIASLKGSLFPVFNCRAQGRAGRRLSSLFIVDLLGQFSNRFAKNLLKINEFIKRFDFYPVRI